MAYSNRQSASYDSTWEEPAGKQINKMLEIAQHDYYEIWCGADGYAVSTAPKRKLYDSMTDDDSLLVAETGLSLEEFTKCVISRCGCCYLLNRETYPQRTGQVFPEAAGTDTVIVINFATNWFSGHHETV